MSKLTKKIGFILVLTLLCTALVSCGDNVNNQQTTSPDTTVTPPISLEIIKDGTTDFVVCRPDETTENIVAICQTLIGNITTFTGANLTFKTDWLKPDVEPPAETLEILIGNTNRSETQQILKDIKYNDYFIGVVGNKLVIVGGNDTATVSAVNYFIKNFLKEQNPTESSNGNLTMTSDNNYSYLYNYRIDALSCLDKSINEYSIVIPADPSISEYRFAVEFKDYISRYVGYILPIKSDDEAETEYEILIGNTSRTNITVADNEYKVNINGTKLQILADNLFAYELLYNKIRDDIIPASEDSISLTSLNSMSAIDTTNTCSERTGDIRLLINNVLGNCDTSIYPVPQRSQMLAELYLEYDPDVIGLQECSGNSRTSSASIINELEGYTEVFVTVTNSDNINYTPLLYRADRLTLIDSGYYLYSDGENDRSKSITWAVFEVKSTGKRFAVCSTHFYWESDANAARVLDATQLISAINTINTKYNCPIFSGGDYNCISSTEPYQKLITAGYTDIQTIAKTTMNLKTTHSYPEFNTELGIYDVYYDISGTTYSNSIDHIFLAGNTSAVEVMEFRIINDKYALLSTDHTPLITDFNLK